MFIVGESYAGIYVPTLVQSILANNGKAGFEPQLNVAGFGIGDGCIGHEDMPHIYRTPRARVPQLPGWLPPKFPSRQQRLTRSPGVRALFAKIQP